MTDETAAPTPHPEDHAIPEESVERAMRAVANIRDAHPYDVALAALDAAMPLCQAEELNTWIASVRASAAGLEATGHDDAATALKILARQMRARYAELRSSVAAQTEEA